MTRDEALGHAAAISAATGRPVSADLENGFADDPAGVAATIDGAIAAGLSGCSIEDFTRNPDDPIYELGLATERIAAAGRGGAPGTCASRAHSAPRTISTDGPTSRTPIARLRAYQHAGADVLFAPGLTAAADIRQVVKSVDLPLNVVARPGLPAVTQLAELGVRRISVGQAFAYLGYGAAVEAAREFLQDGTYGFMDLAGTGVQAGRTASPDPASAERHLLRAELTGSISPRACDRIGAVLTSAVRTTRYAELPAD